MESSETSIESTAGQTAAAGTEAAVATSETAVETVVATTEETVGKAEMTQEQVVDTTTQEPAEANSGACALLGYDRTSVSIVIAVVVVAITLVALLTKKKKGPKSAPGKSGKSNGVDIVEIYVGNLSYDMNDAQLRREFERFGVVKSARVITHRTNGKSKGYGFVEMPHRKEAIIGIKALDNSEVMGRRIRVNEARANTRPPER